MTKAVSFKLIDWRKYAKAPYHQDSDHFKIESMTNTTQFVAGGFLTENEVNDLISTGDFSITIRGAKESDFNT